MKIAGIRLRLDEKDLQGTTYNNTILNIHIILLHPGSDKIGRTREDNQPKSCYNRKIDRRKHWQV